VEIEARVVSASRSFAAGTSEHNWRFPHGIGGRNIIGGDSDVGKSTLWNDEFLCRRSAIAKSDPPVMPFVTNLGAVAPTSGLLLAHRSTNFAVDFFITAAEAKGVWQTALQAESDYTEQRESDGQAGNQDSDSDDHQQYDLGAVH